MKMSIILGRIYILEGKVDRENLSTLDSQIGV